MFGYLFLASLFGFLAAAWGLIRPYLNMQRRWFAVAGALFFVGMPVAGSCGQAAYEASPEGHRARAQQDAYAERDATLEVAKVMVRAELRDPESAEFIDLRIVTVGGEQAVCGLVNSKNGFAGMAGPTPFVDLPKDGVGAVSFAGMSTKADKNIERFCG